MRIVRKRVPYFSRRKKKKLRKETEKIIRCRFLIIGKASQHEATRSEYHIERDCDTYKTIRLQEQKNSCSRFVDVNCFQLSHVQPNVFGCDNRDI